MYWIKRLLFIIAAVYLILLVFVYVVQRSFIYFPSGEPAPSGFGTSFNVETVNVDVGEIGSIKSYYHPPENGEPFIIVFHGNASEAYQLTAEINSFHEWGVGFLMASYPGYAGNPGKPSEDDLLTSANAHYNWAVSQGIDPKNIVLYGHSLGAASAVHIASDQEAALLVISAPFLSMRAMGRRQMPIFPTNWLLKDQYRSDLKMPDVNAPLLVFHGQKDFTIPSKQGESLFEKHMGEKSFVLVEGHNHNNLWRSEMPALMRDAIAENVIP